MRTLFLATAAFAALMMGAPIGNAHAQDAEIDGEVLAPSTQHYLREFDRHHRHSHRDSVAQAQDGGTPEYRQATRFEQIKSACEAYADSASPAYISPGSNDLNSNIAELGKTVGSWAGHSRAYDHCMVAQGYVRNQ